MRYMVTAGITISVHTLVDAESVEEARELALKRPMGSVSSDPDAAEEEWIVEELDGDVQRAGVCVAELPRRRHEVRY